MPSAADERPLRADARRNRDRVLAAAVRAFAGAGPGATIEAIARDAGVGVGTVYRHFPTREALIEAAYRSELVAVCAAAPVLLTEQPPAAALRAWMARFVDYMTTKIGMTDALRTVIAAGTNPYAQSRDMLDDALDLFLAAGGADGSLRTDVPADDVLISLSGIALAAGAPDQRAQAGRLLDLLMDALVAGSTSLAENAG
ncbi:TetR family transcriptional regulator [Asanoa ishikariensis]|uniref:Transcriptional regulator, TetR family n=1 Tax=Asanoa ishikariensis TaxID=137265 RepID=A0A1H3MX86_9ACTN|nr:TetR/AcrR family transcriptional regulator [Asanoa ishikariensis]GIF68984.1 TetR family transcriptional regulator [Asanoa ishikariensis]SDY81327.1 transcriptional regulator, TetR family [Asanoa ishikariensis]